jgi:hypothetical protein
MLYYQIKRKPSAWSYASRFGHLLKIRLEDIHVQAQHQAGAPSAQSRVIIKSGYPPVSAPTIPALVFVDRQNQPPTSRLSSER